MVGWVSTNSYESIKSSLKSSQPTVDWDVNGGVDGVSIKYWGSVKSINQGDGTIDTWPNFVFILFYVQVVAITLLEN